MEMSIESRERTAQKFAAMMGLDQPSGLDLVQGQHFANDDELLDAATRLQMERETPAYQQTRRQLAAQLREQREREQREADSKRYAEIRSAVQLFDQDRREIDAEAADMARRDLAAGRISASGLGAAIEKYAAELTEKRKDERASNTLFNSMLRGQR